jgi:hypothetical protein
MVYISGCRLIRQTAGLPFHEGGVNIRYQLRVCQLIIVFFETNDCAIILGLQALVSNLIFQGEMFSQTEKVLSQSETTGNQGSGGKM